jgi:hypothetical protein
LMLLVSIILQLQATSSWSHTSYNIRLVGSWSSNMIHFTTTELKTEKQ